MENAWIFLIIAVITGLMTAIGWITNYYREKKRREVMTAFASEVNLDYFPVGDSDLMNRMRTFSLFSKGKARRIKNLVYGATDDEVMCVFDYKYTTGSGKNQTVHWQTVVAIESRNIVVPNFVLRPGGLFSRGGHIKGMKSVTLDRHPDFSDNQNLYAANEEHANEFFDDRLTRTLATNDQMLEATFGRFVMYNPKKLVGLSELKSFLGTAFEIYTTLSDRAADLKK